ncbi:hypothetical protein [Desulfomarina sp.]
MSDTEKIRKRLAELEKEIEETKKRLPAHSVKPPVMMDLLALEDERDELLTSLQGIAGERLRVQVK